MFEYSGLTSWNWIEFVYFGDHVLGKGKVILIKVL